jgi:membrane-bound lytic murein transglycosylase B
MRVLFNGKIMKGGAAIITAAVLTSVLSSSLNINLVTAQAENQVANAAYRAQLEAELAKVEKEIAEQTKLLRSKQTETASIQRDVDILNAEIRRARLNIQAKQIEIRRLGGDIGKREQTIEELEAKQQRELKSLAELIRKTRDMDDITLTEVVLTSGSLVDLYQDFDAFENVQQALQHSFQMIRDTKTKTEQEKTTLVGKRSAEMDAQKAIESQKAIIERNEQEKKRLLNISKSQENTYKQVIADREKEKARIRNALFQLRDSTNINFGQALDLANEVSRKTGVRTALILAIITQESNLGQNVGTCVITDLKTGQTKHVSTGRVYSNGIHPTRDLPVLQRVIAELGRDPLVTRVSCPLSVGYGGAMGPSQFIPSTWVMYNARVANLTGNRPADPWNPRDAFHATGLLLADLGAARGGHTNERTAALKYYAGGNWSAPHNAFYGDSVMRIAAQYQGQIDILAKN